MGLVEMEKLDLNKVKYVLFDWDNTLAESKTALLYAIRQVIAEKNLPCWEDLEKRRNHDLSFRENFENFFADRAHEIYERYAEIYKQNVERLISTFPGVREVLDLLREKQIPLMIMSNKDRNLLEFELPFLFDPKRFERVVCGQEAPRDKPFKDHVLYTLCGYLKPEEITQENVWVVGDSPQDSSAALGSNALPIRIGKNIWHDYETYNDKVVYFNDFLQFYAHLKQQN